MGVHDDGFTAAGAELDDAAAGPDGACWWTRRDPDVLREVLAALRQLD